MATEPTVCAVMLTANRGELARRAVECFRAQTYQRKKLFILNSGVTSVMSGSHGGAISESITVRCAPPATIGELRNSANRATGAEVYIHWDDDDYSHPNRITEQVALLQSSGAEAVGYREMLFWREPVYTERNYQQEVSGQAWLYSSPNPTYALGTSLCYWRRTREAKPFEAVNSGEDTRWIAGLNVATTRAFSPAGINRVGNAMMIARIHPGNTSKAYDPAVMTAVERQGGEWKRVPAWDSYCREVMA